MKKDKMVTTINGESVLKSKTRKISGEYYKIGDINVENSGDCYLIDDKYYRSNTGYIVYDHTVGNYVIYNSLDYIEGVIGFEDKSDPIYGFFSKYNTHGYPTVRLIDGFIKYVLNDDILKNTDYYEDLRSGIYHHKSKMPARYFAIPDYCDDDDKRQLPYDAKSLLNKKIALFNKTKDSIEISDTVSKYAGCLHNLSLGLEFETIKGFIPNRISNRLGLTAVRDGSVQGLEYVTVPMEGSIGLQAISDSITELKRRTEYDDSCSLHLHIGNIPRTEEFILALFKLLTVLQDDIYALFPLYKKYNFGYKRKHYTKPLPINQTIALMDSKITPSNIKDNFSILFEYFSMGIPYSNYYNELDKVRCHPSDPEGSAKWNIRSRYVGFNFIPLIFGNKQTIEFRLHTPTYDHNKIMNYIFMCTSIIQYAKINETKILENRSFLRDLSLNDILYNVGLPDNMISTLSHYINCRTQYVYNKNRNSEIHFSEDDFIFDAYNINWDPNALKISPISKVINSPTRGLDRDLLNRLNVIMMDRPAIITEDNEEDEQIEDEW